MEICEHPCPSGDTGMSYTGCQMCTTTALVTLPPSLLGYPYWE